MDPRVLAIMAQFEEEEKRAAEKPQEVKFKPPTNLEEFMKVEALREWPQRLTSEGILDIRSEADLFGSQEDIASILREAAPLGIYMLQELEDQLDVLENKLSFYADQIVSETRQLTGEQEGMIASSPPPESPARTFITEVSQSDAVKSHRSSKGHRSLDFAESLMDAKKKSIEYCQFPGFRHGELIELPGQLESPPILHRVTKAQDFNTGFKRFWKKLFLSEASVAVMQDTFWWFFINKYEPKDDKNKDLLYDRIADSYVALFTSIHKDVKDKFLTEYPNCLAQAVFTAYYEAFPESREKLDENFKQDLANVVHEWITGLKPLPGTWKKWDLKRLEKPKGMERESEATKKMLQVAELNKGNNLGQEMDSFSKIMDTLGKGDDSQTVTSHLSPQSREYTRLTTLTTLTSLTNGTASTGNQAQGTLSQISPSRLATRGTSFERPGHESHQIGPGPDYERVMFNTQGRSPLISHYLHMRQLRDYHQPGKKVRRTEIAKLPPPGPTYRQLIQNTLSMSAALKKEYQKICEQTNNEIRELERKQRDTNREINRLTRELIFNKNPLDLKILSEKIVSMREKDTKDISIIEKDPEPAMIKVTAENGEDVE